jgi:hypothetical protein
MARTRITTSHTVVSCDVCGRRLLRGEQFEVFLAGGERRMVCELCTTRAAHEGWLREGLDDVGVRRNGGRRGRSLLDRLRARREAALAREEALADGSDPPAAASGVVERHVHAVPTNAEMKMARALEVFNAGEQPRTVAGVARSRGAPTVAVRPSRTEGTVVQIVAAWELTWYRFEVDLGNEAAGVRVVAQGSEVSELEPEDLAPNAAAEADGSLHLLG